MLKKRHLCFPLITFLLLLSGIFRVNRSDSLPETLFFSFFAKAPFQKGQIVRIEHPDLQIVVGKIIAGQPGDRIFIHDDIVFLNEIEIGPFQTVSKSGKTYHPTEEVRIPEGHYFVYTPHIDSFDSRYQEFGLIKEEWIKGVLWPIF